jgi:hypothetical protein
VIEVTRFVFIRNKTYRFGPEFFVTRALSSIDSAGDLTHLFYSCLKLRVSRPLVLGPDLADGLQTFNVDAI